MVSSGMLRRMALIRIDVSKQLGISIITVTRIGVPSSPILVTLMMEALRSSETSVLTKATRRNTQDDAILHYYYIYISMFVLESEVIAS
jgi:hypothetical protein